MAQQYRALRDHFIDKYILAGEVITLPEGVKPGEYLLPIDGNGNEVAGAYAAAASDRVNTQAGEVMRQAREEVAKILADAQRQADDIVARAADQRDLRVAQSALADQPIAISQPIRVEEEPPPPVPVVTSEAPPPPPPPEADDPLKGMTKGELREEIAKRGLEQPPAAASKDELIAALKA